MSRSRVVAVGQRAAGDDAVGFAVLDRLRAMDLDPDVDLLAVAEPTRLIELLAGVERVVVLDALVGAAPPGEVLELTPAEVATRGLRSLSSHGVGVAEAVALARMLQGWDDAHRAHDVGDARPRGFPVVRIVAVTIAPPDGISYGLSPVVARAVERAADVARRALSASGD